MVEWVGGRGGSDSLRAGSVAPLLRRRFCRRARWDGARTESRAGDAPGAGWLDDEPLLARVDGVALAGGEGAATGTTRFGTEAVGGLGALRAGTVGAVTVGTGGSSFGSDRVGTGGTLTVGTGTGTGIDGTATLGVGTGSSTARAGAAAKATESTSVVKPSTRIPPLKCGIGVRARRVDRAVGILTRSPPTSRQPRRGAPAASPRPRRHANAQARNRGFPVTLRHSSRPARAQFPSDWDPMPLGDPLRDGGHGSP